MPFITLENTISKAPCTQIQDSDLPTTVETDSSGFTLGAVLFQTDAKGESQSAAFTHENLIQLKETTHYMNKSSWLCVKVDIDDTVDDLKNAIKGERPNDLKGIDVDRLILWHVSIPSVSESIITLNNLNGDGTTTPGCRKDPTSEISEVIGTDPTNKTIHVIVQRQSTCKHRSELPHYTDDYD
ncbi:hypothetical protein BGZ76_007024, partial [Entomortierella beljakovae]